MAFCSQNSSSAYNHVPVLLLSPFPTPTMGVGGGGTSLVPTSQHPRFLAFPSSQGPVLQPTQPWARADGALSPLWFGCRVPSESALRKACAKPAGRVGGRGAGHCSAPGSFARRHSDTVNVPREKRTWAHSQPRFLFVWGGLERKGCRRPVCVSGDVGSGGKPWSSVGWRVTLQGGSSSKERAQSQCAPLATQARVSRYWPAETSHFPPWTHPLPQINIP